ncbi:hypothetical protein PN498_13470 [Oscillatoria sp. CS-180]|uniref:hypothetical protein n=1 Tax=Oscillatoria sp. CS-180 TaxID=3021720 RepID=UPI00232C8AC7|nr:hypothetical protein [Oscillatoria sp. CS-180]MDB9527004.1 hypothetical protein [Oscillatoria sp. CS-180]
MPSKTAIKKPTALIPAPLFIMALISSVLLLLVGGGLFFVPEFARPRWVWSLTPFNTRFLGAVYLTALIGLSFLLVTRRALSARLIVPLMWVFTTVVLVVSFLHVGQFDPARRATAIWFGVYGADCLGSSYYLGRYGKHMFAASEHVPGLWKRYLWLQAIFLGVYGLGLLLLPARFGLFWPWPLDAFHCQIYSAMFLTGATGAALLARHATALEFWAFGLIQATLSGFVVAGVVIVDRAVRKIDWESFGNWAWMGAFVLLGLAGLAMVWESLQINKLKDHNV